MRTYKRGDTLYADCHYAINLTQYNVDIYDAMGNIISFCPGHGTEYLKELNPDAMVILEDIAEGSTYGVPEDNAVVILSCGIGHGGHPVSKLVRPKDGAIINYLPQTPFLFPNIT